MTDIPDYYAILQVHLKASKEVIDAAYHKLALKYHPDVDDSPKANEKMKLLNEAYEVLSDPARRTIYDNSRQRTSSSQPLRNRNWRSIFITIGMVLILMMVAKLGIRLALILLVLIAIVWFVGRIRQ